MDTKPPKATMLLLALVFAWMTTSACACTALLDRALGFAQGTEVATEVPATARPEIVATPRGTDEPGTFTIEITEADIREMLAEETFSHDTIAVVVDEVKLGEGQVRVRMQVAESEMGLDVGVEVVGEPHVENGKAYVRVISFTLDPSVTGFVRMLAQAAIREAIDRATEGQGIPVPVDDVQVLSVEVQPGVIVIQGRRP